MKDILAYLLGVLGPIAVEESLQALVKLFI